MDRGGPTISIVTEVTDTLVARVKELVQEIPSINQVTITPEYLTELIHSDASRLLIAKDSEQNIQGFAVLVMYRTLNNPRALLETLVVSPKARRQGIAKALVRKALEEANKYNVNTVRASTGIGNVGANALFESEGFVKEKGYVWYEFNIREGPRQ